MNVFELGRSNMQFCLSVIVSYVSDFSQYYRCANSIGQKVYANFV
jgi:hypothetical protein